MVNIDTFYYRDYAPNPELDRYDEEQLDPTEYAPMTMEERRQAEQALAERDWREGRRTRIDFSLTAGRVPSALMGKFDGADS